MAKHPDLVILEPSLPLLSHNLGVDPYERPVTIPPLPTSPEQGHVNIRPPRDATRRASSVDRDTPAD